MITDTDRLDWFLNTPSARFCNYNTSEFETKMVYNAQGAYKTVYGNTMRDCIDKVLMENI
jgi:hypothetical protein